MDPFYLGPNYGPKKMLMKPRALRRADPILSATKRVDGGRGWTERVDERPPPAEREDEIRPTRRTKERKNIPARRCSDEDRRLFCVSQEPPRVCGAGHSARGFSSLFAAGGRAMVDIRVGVGASSAGGSCKHKLA